MLVCHDGIAISNFQLNNSEKDVKVMTLTDAANFAVKRCQKIDKKKDCKNLLCAGDAPMILMSKRFAPFKRALLEVARNLVKTL